MARAPGSGRKRYNRAGVWCARVPSWVARKPGAGQQGPQHCEDHSCLVLLSSSSSLDMAFRHLENLHRFFCMLCYPVRQRKALLVPSPMLVPRHHPRSLSLSIRKCSVDPFLPMLSAAQVSDLQWRSSLRSQLPQPSKLLWSAVQRALARMPTGLTAGQCPTPRATIWAVTAHGVLMHSHSRHGPHNSCSFIRCSWVSRECFRTERLHKLSLARRPQYGHPSSVSPKGIRDVGHSRRWFSLCSANPGLQCRPCSLSISFARVCCAQVDSSRVVAASTVANTVSKQWKILMERPHQS